MNEYRIWNLDSGVCFDSEVAAETPQGAFDKAMNGSLGGLGEGVRYIVAKTTAGFGSNHDEFGVFTAERPKQPRLVSRKVTL